MFCTTLRQRPDLAPVIPFFTSSTTPKLRETTLTTHDLALPVVPNRTSQTTPQTQIFLILTTTSLNNNNNNNPHLLERITRFSTLAYAPAPTIAFILSDSHESHGSAAKTGMHAYMHLQTITHTLPTPPPLLPIPSPPNLLPLLLTYLTPASPHPFPPTTPQSPLLLLPHTTSSAPSRPLPTHATNVLSDICHSLKDIIEMVQCERGRREMEEWLGRGEAGGGGVVEVWEGEWVCGWGLEGGWGGVVADVRAVMQCELGWLAGWLAGCLALLV
ncbi:hypothetical protein N7G274_005935 [Stereocaulon virgatum]|uniref:Uncharacterized protein n=1 Tax=Stereocaulon virgatum TaxID=373712 RepID=A0ABR4A8Z9_9LECA